MKPGSRVHMQYPRFATHFPSQNNPHSLNSTTMMFMQDVPLGVMPLGGSTHRAGDFSVEIKPNETHKYHISAILASFNEFDRYDSYVSSSDYSRENYYSLRELLSDAINMIATTIASHGRATYEIVWDEENSTYRLYQFTQTGLFRAFGKYIQLIPKADQDLWKKRCVIAHSKDVWDVCIPSKLGGLRGYRRSLKRLNRLDSGIPSFWRSVNFDFQKHTREQAIFNAKTIAPWGWNQRDPSGQYWTEIYQFYRELQLKWAQALIREHVLKEINRLLLKLNLKSEIVISGLPTSSYVMDVRQQMLDGKISFLDALNACSI